MTTGTISRGLCKSEAERLAAACALPVALAEKRFLIDYCRCSFDEPLNIGTAHSLPVGLFLLLLPTLLSFEGFGHDAEPLLLGWRYQTCCACRLNMARADRSRWTRMAQVSGTVNYYFSFSR